MKRKTLHAVQYVLAALALSVWQLNAFAQEKGVEINTTTTSTSTTSNTVIQPWMYVLGAAIFILLLVALLRNNRNRG